MLRTKSVSMEGETKKFSWGAVQAVASVSLAEVMSEELAVHLHQQERDISTETCSFGLTVIGTTHLQLHLTIHT